MPLQRQRFDADLQGPLHGIRVLDFSRLVAGNMVSLQLADFGAEVVKVEAPRSGDTLRDWREKGISVHWKVYARNKKSITLDLKAPDAPEVILDLAEHLDGFEHLDRPFGPVQSERHPQTGDHTRHDTGNYGGAEIHGDTVGFFVIERREDTFS